MVKLNRLYYILLNDIFYFLMSKSIKESLNDIYFETLNSFEMECNEVFNTYIPNEVILRKHASSVKKNFTIISFEKSKFCGSPLIIYTDMSLYNNIFKKSDNYIIIDNKKCKVADIKSGYISGINNIISHTYILDYLEQQCQELGYPYIKSQYDIKICWTEN